MKVSVFLKVLLKRKKIFIIWLLVGVLIALSLFFFQKPSYVASTAWSIQKISPGSILTIKNETSKASKIKSTFGSLIKKSSAKSIKLDAEILLSADVLKQVIKKENIKDSSGKPVSVRNLRQRFKIITNKILPVMVIIYSSNDPQEVYDVLMTLEQVFIEQNVNAELNRTKMTKKFLQEQIIQTEKDAEKASLALKNYEKRSRIIDIDSETIDQQNRLIELRGELEQLNAQLQELTTKITDIKKKLVTKSVSQSLDKAIIGSNPTITLLKSELVNKNSRLITLQAKYTEKHHTIIQIKEEIQNLKSEIEQSQKNTIGKVLSYEKIEGVKSVKIRLIDELIDLTTQEISLVARIKAINENLKDYQSLITMLPNKKALLESLQDESEFQQSKLEKLKLSYESAVLQEAFAKNSINITKLRLPVVPRKPTFPNIFLNLILGVSLSFLCAYIHFLIVECSDNKIKNPEQLEYISNCSYLGQLPCEDIDLITIYNTNNEKNKEYEELRSNLSFIKSDIGANNLAFLYVDDSLLPSIALTNLAVSLAQSNKRVLLVEVNYDLPNIHKLLFLDKSRKGLSDYLVEDKQDYNEFIQKLKITDNLYFFPSGVVSRNTSSLLDSNKMKELIRSLSSDFDYVLYNLPPFNKSSDAFIVSNYLDGNILTAICSKTTVSEYESIQKILKTYSISALGAILLL